jgi:topoisomerase-4 subunit A
MVKRFMIETTTQDKEFGFISESIGSRLVLVTTSETPEVELELIKGKDKGKSTQVINLEEIVDVKGWKALGNRLSEFKVSKVNLVQEEESGPEGGDGDNEDVEVPGSKNLNPSESRDEKKNGKTLRTTTSGSAKASKQTSSRSQKSASSKPSKKVSQDQKSKWSSKTSSRKPQQTKSKKQVKSKR